MGLSLTGQPKIERNDLCPCGSKLKYKWCHGDESKRLIVNRVANLKMMELVLQEQKKRGIMPWKYKCHDCKHGFDKPKESVVEELNGKVFLCPKCDSSYLTEGKNEEDKESNI